MVGIALIAAIAALGVSRFLTPVYSATGNVLVVAGPQQNPSNGVSLTSSQVTSTAAALMTEPPLLQRVINELHLREDVESLAKRVSATPERDTELVDVVVRDPSARRATDVANRLMADFAAQVTQQNEQRAGQAGKALQDQITQLESMIAQEQTDLVQEQQQRRDTSAIRAQIQANNGLLAQLTTNYGSFKAAQTQNLETVSVAAPATLPKSPSSPRVVINTLLGALAGLVLAGGLAALLEYLDQGLHSEEDVRTRLGVPCLGIIPRYHVSKTGKMAQKSERRAHAAGEAYRRLRTNILFSSLDAPLRCVVVTSVRAGEGKSRTSANLAVALAASEKRVLLVDGDMRRPSQHRLFAQPMDYGVSDMLLATATHEGLILNGEHATRYPNLSLITCGTIPPNPSELLASSRAKALLRAFESQYDMVVVDTPPADVVGDALSLAANASATVVVIEAGKTNATEATRVIESIEKVGAKVVGVVLNKARERDLGAYYYYGYKDNATLVKGRGKADERWVPLGDAAGVPRNAVR
ncbi:MAG: hypothetical protein NVS2B16_18940 [Chloroflexota bacterium]